MLAQLANCMRALHLWLASSARYRRDETRGFSAGDTMHTEITISEIRAIAWSALG
jgi:hypothetical protein